MDKVNEEKEELMKTLQEMASRIYHLSTNVSTRAKDIFDLAAADPLDPKIEKDAQEMDGDCCELNTLSFRLYRALWSFKKTFGDQAAKPAGEAQ